MKNKWKIFFSVFFIIVFFSLWAINYQNRAKTPVNNHLVPTIIITQEDKLVDQFEYSGQEGVDALTLLKQKTLVEQNSSGMVVSISGRKADDGLREFWSFYINGESAQVGPASYITKNNDIINWKIEKY